MNLGDILFVGLGNLGSALSIRIAEASKQLMIYDLNLQVRDEIQKKQKSLIEEKKNAQPSQIKTGGSTFKNTLNKKAWKLIEESNCQKFQVGSAKMSEKHYNFFVNDGNTTAKELEDLINKVKDEVHKKTKINLELEIKIIGYNN